MTTQRVILQAGMEKSGNYWLYKIIQSALTHCGHPVSSFIQQQPIHAIARTWPLSYHDQADIDVLDIETAGLWYRISSIYRMPVTDLDAYLTHAGHIWTHALWNRHTPEVVAACDRVVYIVRDPRDVALSLARFLFTPYMQTFYPTDYANPDAVIVARLVKYLNRWRTHVGGWVMATQTHGVHVVFYERLLHDFEATAADLLRYLDIEPTPELLACLRADTDFGRMRAQNPDHVQQGRSMGWVDGLNTEQQAVAVWHTGVLMSLLGYPLSPTDDRLPRLPSDLTTVQIERAARPPAMPLRDRIKRAVKVLVRGRQ